MPPKYYKKKNTKIYNQSNENNMDINNYKKSKYLIIVESPSKCKKIEGFLGNEYKCIASKGHICRIQGLKSINIKNNFETEYSIIEDKKNHVEYMRSVIDLFPYYNILLASDDDREGEAISWHICNIFNLPIQTTPRIIFHEITKTSILKAIDNPTTINMSLVYAQQARQILDMLVGFKVSPFLWKYIYNNKTEGLSAGRCQTPALRLVYDNQKRIDTEIKNTLHIKYKTTASFFNKNLLFKLDYDYENSTDMNLFLEKSKSFKYNMEIGSPKISILSPPSPLNTSKLLQLASTVLRISPKETTIYSQQLYQDGYITYMRTDSTKYSKEFLQNVQNYIYNKWNHKTNIQDYFGNVEELNNTNTITPHEAIRITNIELSQLPCSYTNDSKLKSLYKLIWKTTIESCMTPSKINITNISITAPENHSYIHSLETPVFLGWKIVSFENKNNDEEQPKDMNMNTLQNQYSGSLLYFQSILTNCSQIICNSIESIVSVHNHHSHYTEASIIHKLEELGIGRPSTFSSIINTIQERGYVKLINIEGKTINCIEYKLCDNIIHTMNKERVFGNEKNKLVIQPIGIVSLEFLLQYFESIFSYEYTKLMEKQLDDISNINNNTNWYSICRLCLNEIINLSKPLINISKQTYKIDNTYDFVFQKDGYSLKYTNDDGTVLYKSVKPSVKIDLEKLKNGGYTIDDLIEIKNDCLGKYEDHDIYIKNGLYGPYVKWGEHTESIKTIQKPLNEITLLDVSQFINNKRKLLKNELEDNDPNKLIPLPNNKSILRILTTDLSIRKGKFGAYIFYQRSDMKTPEFYSMKGFNKGFLVCEKQMVLDWIVNTYSICI